MTETTHESMDIDVLCDAKTFETEVGLTQVESMAQCSETRKEIVATKEEV